MARILVISEDRSPMLDEHVEPIHLRDLYARAQLAERLAWAVEDANRAQTVRKRKRIRMASDYRRVQAS